MDFFLVDTYLLNFFQELVALCNPKASFYFKVAYGPHYIKKTYSKTAVILKYNSN